MNWLLRCARSRFDFLGTEMNAFRAVDLHRAIHAIRYGFKNDQFFTTDPDRAVFYANFTETGIPGAILECTIDSSRSSLDLNDATINQSDQMFQSIASAADKITRILSEYDIDVETREIDRFIGTRINAEGYYDAIDTPSIFMFIGQNGITPRQVSEIITPGYYSDLIYIDSRGVPGVAGDQEDQQMHYSYEVPPENISAIYLHSSICRGVTYDKYSNGAPKNGFQDSVSVIASQIRELIDQLEEQLQNTPEESALFDHISDLKEYLEESVMREEVMDRAVINGNIYRKLYANEMLTELDFDEPVSYFIRFSLPENKMRALLIMNKALNQRVSPDRQMKFPFMTARNWLHKITCG